MTGNCNQGLKTHTLERLAQEEVAPTSTSFYDRATCSQVDQCILVKFGSFFKLVQEFQDFIELELLIAILLWAFAAIRKKSADTVLTDESAKDMSTWHNHQKHP